MKSLFNWLSLLILGLFLAVTLWYAHSVFVLNNAAVYSENGPLENLQASVLAITTLIFLAPLALNKPQMKLIFVSCSWLCFSFVLRELDVERFNVPDALKFIGSGAGRNAMLALGFTALLVLAVAKFAYYRKAVIVFLRSMPGILLVLAGIFLVTGEVFEKNHSIIHNAFYEEVFELLGFCLMLLSALAVNCGVPPCPDEPDPIADSKHHNDAAGE